MMMSLKVGIVVKQGYMSYLRNVINLPDTKQFRDCKSSKTLFSLKDDTLPFDISGTTMKSYIHTNNLRGGIQVGFELKKEAHNIRSKY